MNVWVALYEGCSGEVFHGVFGDEEMAMDWLNTHRAVAMRLGEEAEAYERSLSTPTYPEGYWLPTEILPTETGWSFDRSGGGKWHGRYSIRLCEVRK